MEEYQNEDVNVYQDQDTNTDNYSDNDEDRYYNGDFFSFIAGGDEPLNEANEPSNEATEEEQDNTETTEEYETVDKIEELFNREFNSLEEANNYIKSLKDVLLNPDNPIAEKYLENFVINKLAEENSKIEGFAEHYLAFTQNPKEYLIQFYPEKLAEIGIQPVMSGEQIENAIDEKLKQEFGEDYKSQWDPNELLDINSITSRILFRKNELYQHYMDINRKNEEILANWNKNLAEGRSNIQEYGNQGTNIVEEINRQYKDKFLNEYQFSEEDYNKFIEDMQNRTLTMEDMHRVVYFDGYMRLAYERGLEDAKKGVYKKLAAENQGEIVNPTKRTQEQEGVSNRTLPDNWRNLLSGKLTIPYY